jgi:hypothetical protein
MATVQPAVPVQAPLQPAKVDPAAGAAVRLTLVPFAKLALQVVPQLIPAGTEVTVPGAGARAGHRQRLVLLGRPC